MEFLSHLWLPMLLAAVAAWLWSFLSWAMLGLHKHDMKGLPNEEAFSASLRAMNIPPGVYSFPHCEDHKKSHDPEFIKKWEAGPAGMLYMFRHPNMGTLMGLTFVVNLFISFFIAYAGYAALPHASHLKAFQVVGAMGILGYSFAFLPNMIWFQATTSARVTGVMDGIIQGLAVGAIFAMLWPA